MNQKFSISPEGAARCLYARANEGANFVRPTNDEALEVLLLALASKPIEYELTPEGRAIAAAYKKRQEEGNGHG